MTQARCSLVIQIVPNLEIMEVWQIFTRRERANIQQCTAFKYSVNMKQPTQARGYSQRKFITGRACDKCTKLGIIDWHTKIWCSFDGCTNIELRIYPHRISQPSTSMFSPIPHLPYSSAFVDSVFIHTAPSPTLMFVYQYCAMCSPIPHPAVLQCFRGLCSCVHSYRIFPYFNVRLPILNYVFTYSASSFTCFKPRLNSVLIHTVPHVSP